MPQAVPRLKINKFRRGVINYSKRDLRRFPWRVRTTPYRVLVSELMLQRTGAGQVVSVYLKFLENLPTLKLAADAKSQKLKRLLFPLGRTDRYRVLAQTFRHLGREHSCRVPNNLEELMRVPGIGPYTARSVLCFGYGKRVGLIDPGIYRVFRRVFGIRTTRNRFHTIRSFGSSPTR